MKTIKSLYYHNPKSQGFEKMILHYLKKGYRFIALSELYEILRAGKSIHDKLAFISLDDGWRGNLKLIPIIERYQIPICIFVSTEPMFSGNYWWEYVVKNMGVKQMFEFKKLPYTTFYKRLAEIKIKYKLERSAITIEELKEISRHPLITIQSHTVNHPILTNSPDDVLKMELCDSKMQLEEMTGKRVYAFSYPNGSLTNREVCFCKKYYDIAFTTEQRHIRISDDLYVLPRYALTGQYFRDLLKVNGIWKILKKIIRN